MFLIVPQNYAMYTTEYTCASCYFATHKKSLTQRKPSRQVLSTVGSWWRPCWSVSFRHIRGQRAPGHDGDHRHVPPMLCFFWVQKRWRFGVETQKIQKHRFIYIANSQTEYFLFCRQCYIYYITIYCYYYDVYDELKTIQQRWEWTPQPSYSTAIGRCVSNLLFQRLLSPHRVGFQRDRPYPQSFFCCRNLLSRRTFDRNFPRGLSESLSSLKLDVFCLIATKSLENP